MPTARRSAAIILGCAGLVLSESERHFFAELDPAGFILFKRNIENREQVIDLVKSLRDCVGHEAPVLIDQEGGRVQRLGPPHWRKRPTGAALGGLYKRDPQAGKDATRLAARLIATDLAALGIDVDCAPVLDLPVPGAHDVIGDRAFATDSETVSILAQSFCDGLLDGGVCPVIKHVPGHGKALVDSHKALPVVTAPRNVLEEHDFLPFRALQDAPWAMTAHVVYEALDPALPATLSPRVIDGVIRRWMGFDGVLVSDDLGMHALSGDFAERARLALAAGCDLTLHCSGDLEEMQQLAPGLSPLTDIAAVRLERAGALRRKRLQAAPPLPPEAESLLEPLLELARS